MAVRELLMSEPTCRIEPGDSPGVWVRKLSDGSGGSPQALVATGPGQRKTEAHFHDVAQFQVVLEGKLTFVGHPLEAIAVHYTDARTPYGFFVADSQAKFATLRPRKGGIVWMYDAEKRESPGPAWPGANRSVRGGLLGGRFWDGGDAAKGIDWERQRTGSESTDLAVPC